jgi:hypothetical protein
MSVKSASKPDAGPFAIEPNFQLLDYLDAHSKSDTHRMQARAHWHWHRDNPSRRCENPDFPQLHEEMGFWERLRA